MIKIISVGKIKEQYLKDGIKEYLKRISKYSKVEIIEVEDESVGNILEKERDRILKNIGNKDYIITLEIDGNVIDSNELSKKIEEILIRNSTITFIIGGSYGLHDDVKKLSNYKLSFSKLTFPHQLFKMILLEQIYRSFKISIMNHIINSHL